MTSLIQYENRVNSCKLKMLLGFFLKDASEEEPEISGERELKNLGP